MKTMRTTAAVIFTLVLLGASQVASAHIIRGKFVQNWSNLQVWDVSGAYGETIDNVSGISLSVDGAGKIIGDAVMYVPDLEYPIDATVNGTIVRGSTNGITRVTLTIRATRPDNKTETIVLNMRIDDPDSTSLTMMGSGTHNITGETPVPISDVAMTGTPGIWQAIVSVGGGTAIKGNKTALSLTGSADLYYVSTDLSVTNTEMPFDGKGVYDLTTGRALLTYRGTDYESIGSTFRFTMPHRRSPTGPVLFTNLVGTILGQTISIKNPTPERF